MTEDQVARDACAGHRIVDYIARSIAGLPAVFHPYQEGSFAGPACGENGVWVGEFTVAGRRVHLRMEITGEACQ